MKSMKSVFEYNNYREFLKDAFEAKKAENKNFSHRVFARMAGFKASNVLKLVIDGKRHIGTENIPKFAKVFELNQEETQFFCHLVLFEKSKNAEERERHALELMKSKTYRKTFPLKPAQYRYMSQWYYIPIREMVFLPTFREDYQWISKSLFPPITPSEAKRAVEELLALGLLERDQNGKLKQANLSVGTPDEVTMSGAAQFHKEMAKKSAESIDQFPREKREITSATFSVSKEGLEKIKEMIREFRNNVVDVVTYDSKPAESVYQMSVFCFPLFDGEKVGDEK